MRRSPNTARTSIALCAALAAPLAVLLAAGCGDAPPTEDPRARDIARLTVAIEELTVANEALDTELRRQGRQLATLTRDRVSRVSRGVPADADNSAPPPGASPEGSADATHATAEELPGDATAEPDELSAETVDAILDTEAGKKAIEAATGREIERREAKERRLFVSYEIGMFARRAGLDERQTDSLQAIWKKSMDGGVELRRQFAAVGQLPESEREAARAEAMTAMRDLGRERRESVNELLSGEQLEMYEKTDEEIVAGLHGAPRR